MDEKPSFLKAAGQWALAAGTLPWLLGPAAAVGRFSPSSAMALHKRWADLQLKALGIEVHVDDRSGGPRGGVMYVDLFQQTLLSTLVYPQAFQLKATLIVNAEYAALPFLGWTAASVGAVIIVRQWPEQAKGALAQVPARLRAGESFGVSIEGRRSLDGRLSPYKKGPAVLAIEAQCDIVPFISHGEWPLWPRGQWKVKSGRIDAVMYPPLSTKGLTYADRDELVAQLRALAERELGF